MSGQGPADSVRESALQTASSILSLQRRADEEIRALNKALQQRSEELARANIELQRQTETARAQARDVEVFRIAFDSSGSGMLLLSPDLRISRVNAAFCEFIGHPPDALYTRSIADFMLPADLEVTRRGVVMLLRGDVATLHLEYPHKHASGRAVWGSVTSAVVRDADGAPLYLVVQVQDISGRMQTEAEKRQLEAQLLQAQKMEALGTLSGGIAHDFNNILAAILGNAELLHERLMGDAQARETTQEIMEAATRGTELVRQILTFSRRSERRLTPIRLDIVMDQSLRMLRAALPATIEIKSELPVPGATCMADATQIQQLLTNLATNAWHAMEARGGILSVRLCHVEIDADTARKVPDLQTGPHAMICVSDTGEGMDEETLAHMFEPFFTTKPPGKGTGLGLSVVYGIVHLHRGAIRVLSSPGQGTTFEIFLPTIAAQTVVPIAKPARARPGSGERILVVDDEPALVRVMVRLLALLGYSARGTSSPEEAPALLVEEDCDLVIADFNMPKMNGVELARRIHALRPDLPILMMSGYTAPVDPSQLAGLGVREVLEKPISQDAFAEKVGRALRRPPAPR